MKGVGADAGADGLVEREICVRKTARYYMLGQLNEKTLEVWLVCHGYGQLAGRFVKHFAPVVAPQRAVIAPEGLHRFYMDSIEKSAAERRVGATWMTREAREADIADYIAYLDQLCTVVLPNQEVRLTVLGFSQGVATIARWAAATTRAIDQLIFWGATLPPDLDWASATERFRSSAVSLVVGDRDQFWTLERIREQEDLLQGHDIAFRTVHYAGGHHIDGDTLGLLIRH